MKSQLTLLVRAMYSNPPAHGARIVDVVLQVQFIKVLISKYKVAIKTVEENK